VSPGFAGCQVCRAIGASAGIALEKGRSAAHIHWMAKGPGSRLLEVKVTALMPERWEWQVCERDTLIMSGYATSRETAQIDGDSALFLLLRLEI
jgi:hypothetical protein